MLPSAHAKSRSYHHVLILSVVWILLGPTLDELHSFIRSARSKYYMLKDVACAKDNLEIVFICVTNLIKMSK